MTLLLVLALPLLVSAPGPGSGTTGPSLSAAPSLAPVPASVLRAAREAAARGHADGRVEWVETTTSAYFFGHREAAVAGALPDVPVYVVQVSGDFVIAPFRSPAGTELPPVHGAALRTLLPVNSRDEVHVSGRAGAARQDLTPLGQVHTFTLG